MSLELVRGVRDYGPKDAMRLKYIESKVEDMFRRFGFYPIETPSIENLETLNAKAYGDEANKEMYVMDGGKTGLIYDLTVPLARYVAMNRDLGMPFKRYQIAKIWRKDEPQKMRSREFLQADIDIVGSKEPISDAEIVATAAMALESLGLMNYTVLVNSRPILNAILKLFHVKDEVSEKAIIIIDKLGKISISEAQAQISALGVTGKDAEALLNFITEKMGNAEKFQKIMTNFPETKEEVGKLSEIFHMLDMYHLHGELVFDLSLARGLNYYTGAVWEFVVFDSSGKRLPSIASGGRYDNLIGMFSKPGYPAVGISIGLTRLFDVLKVNGNAAYADVYVANIGDESLGYAVSIANFLRASGINVDLNYTQKNISKQLQYANSIGVKYAVIVGKTEMQSNQLKLREMSSGNEEMLDLESVAKKIKGE